MSKDEEYANLSELERINLVAKLLDPLDEERAFLLLKRYTLIIPQHLNFYEYKEEEKPKEKPKEKPIKKDTSPRRPYHKREKVVNLFNKYHTEECTNRETLRRIAKELNAKLETIENSYYKKDRTT